MNQLDTLNKLRSKNLLFIGGGNMASAIIAGLVKKIPSKNISVADHNQEKLEKLQEKYQVNIINNSENKLSDYFNSKQQPDVIILAVKPNVVHLACPDIQALIRPETVVISVAAGVTIDYLSNLLGDSNIIRSMPNTPASIGQGVTILYSPLSESPTESYRQLYRTLANEIFQSIGTTIWVDSEEEINSMMAVSGCGPAYVFLFCESLMAAATKLGIEPNTAKQLITGTLSGACELYASSNKPAEQLRKEVTSPNGTTEAAVNILNPDKIKELYTQALQQAVKRAKIIEQELSDI